MDDRISAAVGAGLRADLSAALPALRNLDPAILPEDDRDLRRRLLDRFDRQSPPSTEPLTGDPVIDALIAAYHDYWWHAVLDPSVAPARLDRLHGAVEAVIGQRHRSLEDLEAAAIEWLRPRGYHALMGVTSPLHELMLWRRQESRTFDVELPEGRQATRVELLDDFVSFGWAHYVTCGKRATGGWATTEALFAVVPRYEDGLDGEPFRVTFLGHESKHHADLRRFGELESWMLEYRAKLVELAEADTSRAQLLQKFTESQSDDPATPHAYANRRVLAEVAARLGAGGLATDLWSAPGPAIRSAALDALRADSATREPRWAPRDG